MSWSCRGHKACLVLPQVHFLLSYRFLTSYLQVSCVRFTISCRHPPTLRAAKQKCRQIKVTGKVKRPRTEPAFESTKYASFSRQHGSHSYWSPTLLSSPLPPCHHCTKNHRTYGYKNLGRAKKLTLWSASGMVVGLILSHLCWEHRNNIFELLETEQHCFLYTVSSIKLCYLSLTVVWQPLNPAGSVSYHGELAC